MSRIGLQPVTIPKGVIVTVEENMIKVKGEKGEISQSFVPVVDFSVNTDQVFVNRKNESRQARAMHGLYRSLLNNMVIGVSRGHQKCLVLNGVGYRAELNGRLLVLNLGYSSSIEYVIPEDIQMVVEGNNKITVSGVRKDVVGQTAAEIRKIRPPEPYKGKGVRYENENVRRKVGKSGAQ